MDIAIIGGGACGVMCAIQLKKKNKDINVTVFEQNDRILKKVLKTGNGKCNISNNQITSEMYNDFRLIENNYVNIYQELFDLGIVLKETTLGRVYPYSESAKTVVSVLLRNLNKLGVKVITNYNVTCINKREQQYIINNQYKFDYIVIASGSKAQETTTGYNLVQSLGHSLTPLIPGLVPIVTNEKTDHLQGIRWKCDAYVNSKKFSGEILFKNDGLSGILSLDISRIVQPKDIIVLDLMPEYQEEDIKNLFGDKELKPEIVLEGIFSKMLASDLLKRSKDLNELIYNIKRYTFTVKSVKDFKEAQIVRGGVKLSEVNNDFSSKIDSNIYLGGEILDVDGASGGYNLYFAWLSGIVVANSINRKILD